MRHRSFWIILAGGLALVIAATVVIITRPTTRTLTIESNTNDVILSINGHAYGAVDDGDNIDVRSRSKVDITASKDGWSEFKTTQTIDDDRMLTLDLTPSSDEAEHALKDDAMDNSIRRQTEKWPILSDLPIEDALFRAYQGIDENTSDPTSWALHLYLYKGQEQKGRDAFQEWIDHTGHTIDGIPIIEHVDNALAPGVTVDPPTLTDLEALSTKDVDVFAIRVPASRDSSQEAAASFATATTSWDPAKDKTRAKALERAQPMMTDKLAKASTDAVDDGYSKPWDWATQHKARSYSWPVSIEQDFDNENKVKVNVCWAFIADDAAPKIEGPREYEITLDPKSAPRISSYTYSDPDPFVAKDPTDECLTHEQ